VRSSICLLVVFSSGCFLSRSLAVGPKAPRRPADCQVRQERLSPADAAGHYQQVGVICRVNLLEPERRADSLENLPRWQRTDFKQRACALGGHVVAVSGFCSIGKDRGIEWMVLRDPSVDRPQ
jgi:hypothetical protein